MGGLGSGVSATWAAQMLPWIVMANIGVTLGSVLLFRIFGAGMWTEQQKQIGDAVKKLTERLEDEHRARRELRDDINVQFGKLVVQVAVIDERIKHLERGGAGRS